MAIKAHVFTTWERVEENGTTVNRPALPPGIAGLAWEDVTGTPAEQLPCEPNGLILLVTFPDEPTFTAFSEAHGEVNILSAEDHPDMTLEPQEDEDVIVVPLTLAVSGRGNEKLNKKKTHDLTAMLTAKGVDKADLEADVVTKDATREDIIAAVVQKFRNFEKNPEVKVADDLKAAEAVAAEELQKAPKK